MLLEILIRPFELFSSLDRSSLPHLLNLQGWYYLRKISASRRRLTGELSRVLLPLLGWRLPLPSTVNPTHGPRGATAAYHPSPPSSWARTARRDRSKDSDRRSAGSRRCVVTGAGRCRFPPLSTLRWVSLELLLHCIPRCPPRGLGLRAGIVARIAPPDCRRAGPPRRAGTDAGRCRFPPLSTLRRVSLKPLLHCIPCCPPRGSDCAPGAPQRLRPRAAAARARAGAPGPSLAAAASLYRQTHAGSSWSYCRITSLAVLPGGSDCAPDRRKDCASGLPQRGPAPARWDRRWRLPLSPSPSLRRVSVGLQPQRPRPRTAAARTRAGAPGPSWQQPTFTNSSLLWFLGASDSQFL